MADTYVWASFGGFAAVTDFALDPTSMDPTTMRTLGGRIDAEVAKLKALIPDPEGGVSAASPDFDHLDPATASKLRAAITTMGGYLTGSIPTT